MVNRLRIVFGPNTRSCVGSNSLLLLAMSLATLTGCWQSSAAPSTTLPKAKTGTTESTAARILRRMVHRYQGADSYTDEAQVRRIYQQGEQFYEEEAFPWSVTLMRPAKLRVAVGGVTIADDGRFFRALPASGWSFGYEGQFVLRPAASEITREALTSDQRLAELIATSPGGAPVQLELLLGDDPLAELFAAPEHLKLLEDESLEERPCFRVQASRATGRYVFWIDRESYLLRRLEFPLDQPPPAAMAIDSAKCVADFPKAAVGRVLSPSKFDLNAPRGALLVKQLVRSPEAISTPLLGRRLGGFSLTKLDGEKVTQQTLAGRVAVLVWFDDQPYSYGVLQRLVEVRSQLPENEQVVMLAVSPQPESVTGEQLSRHLNEWKIDLPIARDLAAAGRDVFLVREAPTVMVLGRDGSVQACGVGADAPLLERLPEVLRQLDDNTNVAAQTLDRTKAEYARFEEELTKANAAGSTSVMALPQATVAKRSDPQQLQLKEHWSSGRLKQPGNLLVVERQDASPRIFACDGFQTVVELDAAGEQVSRHPLDIPDGHAVTYLRTATDGEGRRFFAGCSTLARQVFLFDEHWKRVLSYPSIDQPHEGIGDVSLADLSGTGKLELVVGFWGVVGVQGVSLEGKRVWFNRQVTPALSLSLTPEDELRRRQVIVTSDSGVISRLSHTGELQGQTAVTGRSILQLFSDESPGELATPYCAMSVDSQGQLTAVGLSREMREVWAQPLGQGVYENQIQAIASGPLVGADRNWVVAAPNGAVYVMSGSGGTLDQFHMGDQLSGIALLPGEQSWQLLLSTRQNVSSWTLSQPRAASRGE